MTQASRVVASAVPGSLTDAASCHADSFDHQRQTRAHGYSGETGYISRAHNQDHYRHGSLGRRSVPHRAIRTASHDSPPQSTPQANQPIYVHNPHGTSPPQAGDVVGNTRSLAGVNVGRKGPSNDARLWNESNQCRQNPPDRFEKLSPQYTSHHQRSQSVPFKDHPHAKVTEKSSTFYYQKDAMGQKNEFCNNRTLYIYGATVDMFSSHTLKEMMSEVGTVESISYLYSNPGFGPAFVT